MIHVGKNWRWRLNIVDYRARGWIKWLKEILVLARHYPHSEINFVLRLGEKHLCSVVHILKDPAVTYDDDQFFTARISYGFWNQSKTFKKNKK